MPSGDLACNKAVNSAQMPELKWIPAPPNIVFPDPYSDEDRRIVNGAWMPAFVERAAKYAPQVFDVRMVNKGRYT